MTALEEADYYANQAEISRELGKRDPDYLIVAERFESQAKYWREKVMKKYNVQVQIDVQSTDLLDMEIEANSPDEARVKALAIYKVEGDEFGDAYPADNYETDVNEKNIDKWEVEEIK